MGTTSFLGRIGSRGNLDDGCVPVDIACCVPRAVRDAVHLFCCSTVRPVIRAAKNVFGIGENQQLCA